MSFKYGTEEKEVGDRFFNFYEEESFNSVIYQTKFNLKEFWTTDDVRETHKGEKWLNAILERNKMKEIIYNKLVRDRILEVIEKTGKKSEFHIANEKEYKDLLIKKLSEEVEEFIENPCAEEIADILEVVDSLINILGYSKEEVLKIKEEKKDSRGGFEKAIILEKVIG